ncbi:hypothetical protein BDW69DRAFT_190402 [Aspergillus filifer]
MYPDRDYTPRAATRQQAASFEQSIGMEHAVVTLPSVYGTNNSILLDALRPFNGMYLGVCVLDLESEVDISTLRTFHNAGIRGIRVNYGSSGTDEEIISDVWIPISAFKALHPIIPTLGVRVVADNYAHATAGSRTNDTRNTIGPFTITRFREVIDLVQNHHFDMRVVAETLMINGPDMVIFGSDWPHTASKEGNGPGGPLVPQDFRDIDDEAILEQTLEWAGTQAQVQRLFVDNPRRLWGWKDPGS